MKEKSRLSYVEFATVIIAIGIVSMQVVPKFTQATETSRTDALIQELQEMRTQLKLYRAEHDDQWPPTDSFDSFEAAMTDTDGRHKPYVERIPVNPGNGLNTVRFDSRAAGANRAGWRFDAETGRFQADDCPEHAGL